MEEEEEEDEECDEILKSFPLSTWSQDCGFRALSCDSLHDSDGKKVLIEHNRLNSSQISTTAYWVLLSLSLSLTLTHFSINKFGSNIILQILSQPENYLTKENEIPNINFQTGFFPDHLIHRKKKKSHATTKNNFKKIK